MWEFLSLESKSGDSVCWPNNEIIDIFEKWCLKYYVLEHSVLICWIFLEKILNQLFKFLDAYIKTQNVSRHHNEFQGPGRRWQPVESCGPTARKRRRASNSSSFISNYDSWGSRLRASGCTRCVRLIRRPVVSLVLVPTTSY